MGSRLPISLVLFLATGFFFLLQAIPPIGALLMLFLVPLWSVVLVNAGMVGIFLEAAVGRTPRWWLVLPVLFYGGYWIAAARDQLAARALRAEYDAANAQTHVPFDPNRHALLLEGRHPGQSSLIEGYDLPVQYSVGPNSWITTSRRIVDRATCNRVRENSAMEAASIRTEGVVDYGPRYLSQRDERHCELIMPESPTLPVVRVTRNEELLRHSGLQVTRVVRTVIMPDGRRYRLLDGWAAPLGWLPRPVIACGLGARTASWDCSARFWRENAVSLVSRDGSNTYAAILARALSLRPVAAADRRASNARVIEDRLRAIETSR